MLYLYPAFRVLPSGNGGTLAALLHLGRFLQAPSRNTSGKPARKKSNHVSCMGGMFGKVLVYLLIVPFGIQPEPLLAEQLAEHQLIIRVARIQPNRRVQRAARSGDP